MPYIIGGVVLVSGALCVVAYLAGYHAGRKEGWFLGLRGQRLPSESEWVREVLR